jgi:hypothetical protein
MSKRLDRFGFLLMSLTVVLANLEVADKLGLPAFFRFRCPPSLVALAVAFLASFPNWAALQLEILAPRHQLSVLQRSVKRPKLTAGDQFLWVCLSAVWTDWQPSAIIPSALMMKSATVIG